MKTSSELTINSKEAESILFNYFAINAKCKPLPGEVDHNFKAVTEDTEAYILKISANFIKSFREKWKAYYNPKNS